MATQLLTITHCLICYTETRISAPAISAAQRVTNEMAVVAFDPRDEVSADLFVVDYYLATDLQTPNLVITALLLSLMTNCNYRI